jgi:hypothetical protein
MPVQNEKIIQSACRKRLSDIFHNLDDRRRLEIDGQGKPLHVPVIPVIKRGEADASSPPLIRVAHGGFGHALHDVNVGSIRKMVVMRLRRAGREDRGRVAGGLHLLEIKLDEFVRRQGDAPRRMMIRIKVEGRTRPPGSSKDRLYHEFGNAKSHPRFFRRGWLFDQHQ